MEIFGSMILKASFGFFLVTSFLYFLVIYFFYFPFTQGENFQYGYKQISLFIKDHYNEYQIIVIDPRFGYGNIYPGVPHLYIPYFTYLDAQQIQKSKIIIREIKSGNYLTTPRSTYQEAPDKFIVEGIMFDKYYIHNIDWPNEKLGKKILYIVPFTNQPTGSQAAKLKNVLEIQLPNHQSAFELFATTD